LAGARVSVPARKLGEEERIAVLGLIHDGGSLFIDVQGRRLSSSTSRRRWRIGRCPALHRAVCLLEVEDDRRGKLAGLRGWVLGRLGLRPDGLRPGKCFPLFFSSDSFLFIYLFSVLNSNLYLLFCFAGLN
jgi:hypothetical protein